MNNIQQNGPTDPNVAPTQPSIDPTPPTGQGLGSPNPGNSSKKMILGIVIALVVLAVAGLAYWMLKPATPNTGQQSSTQKVTTQLTNEISGSPTVAVSHPASWVVAEQTGTEGFISAGKTITSDKGNSLELHYSEQGVGYSCEPDTREFTLIEKLPTATTNVYFTEYSVAATATETAYTTGIGIDTTAFDVANKNVGAKGTNTCDTGVGSYSTVGGNSTEDNMFVIVSSPKATDPRNTLFADIADDTEFVAMLQSLKVTIN